MSEHLLPSFYVLIGFVSLVFGGELLVRGASGLAALLRISPLVIGLTIVAFGTSAPELAVAIRATLAGEADISIGNIVGSNIFNVLAILGCSALVAPLVVSRQLIVSDVPLMIIASVATLAVSFNGNVSTAEGLLLFLSLLIYTGWLIVNSRRQNRHADRIADETYEPPTGVGSLVVLKLIGLIIAGLILLSVGSSLLVDGASTLARVFGVSELMIGLTIVAVGTSLPEAATSVMATLRGERDIAVGNVVGSNLFNILSVLGLTALVTPGGVAVSATALQFDIPIMIVVAVVCLPIFYTGSIISRWEGGLLVVYYGLYTTFLIITRNGAPVDSWFQTVIWIAVPITVILGIVSLLKSMGRKSATDL